MKIIKEHTSKETAYAVQDYPYGFRLRTTIFYWVETVKGRGDRFCSYMINPKNGRENAVKKSTYYPFIYLYMDTVGHVKWSTITAYHVEKFPEAIKFIIENIAPISPIQEENLRAEYFGNLRAGYSYIAVKYSDEKKPLYTEWMKETLLHISTAPFAEICNHPAAPEQDKPEETVKFIVTSYGRTA